MMRKIYGLMAALLVSISLVGAQPTAQITGFWNALVAGDTAALHSYYGDTVTIQQQSELLKQQWGICTDSVVVTRTVNDSWVDTTEGGDVVSHDTTFQDTTVFHSCQADSSVEIDILLTGLQELIDSSGTEWGTKLSAIPSENLLPVSLSATAWQLNVVTNIADDTLQFVFTSEDAGTTWKVTSELADY